jgi:multidrug efflux pump subunit AcrA (membrane-fusion protein)
MSRGETAYSDWENIAHPPGGPDVPGSVQVASPDDPEGAQIPARLAPEEPATEQNRRPVTLPQLLGGVLIAAACVAGAMWYVPRIMTADSHSFTGTVTSNGITNLNFASSGRVGTVLVHLGQTVKAGQVLATETAPLTVAAVSADKAAIAADVASLAESRANPPVVIGQVTLAASEAEQAKAIATAEAGQAKDEAQLAADQVKLVETTIVAPAAGTVVAINGQAGETVTSAGIRNYSLPSQQTSQQPAFSLLPQGPTASVKSSAVGSAVPVVALRTSGSWQVVMLVREGSTASVRPGQAVTISVPAVGLTGLHGYIQQLSPTPVNTSSGVAYQVLVNVRGHQRVTPLSGMTADVQLGS